MHLRANKSEKENPTETLKILLVSQVKSYKHKNLSVGSLTSENNTLKICILQPYVSLLFDCKFCLQTENKLESVKK